MYPEELRNHWIRHIASQFMKRHFVVKTTASSVTTRCGRTFTDGWQLAPPYREYMRARYCAGCIA